MLKPPLPMTRTFLTSTRFLVPRITPLLMYAFALGASSPVIFFEPEVLKDRHVCWVVALDWATGR